MVAELQMRVSYKMMPRLRINFVEYVFFHSFSFFILPELELRLLRFLSIPAFTTRQQENEKNGATKHSDSGHFKKWIKTSHYPHELRSE